MTLLLLLKPGGGTATAPIVVPVRSVMGSAIANALSALGSAVGQTLQWRATPAGTFASLSGAFLLPGPPQVVSYDDRRNAVFGPQTARLKVPTGLTHFVPGANGAQIMDQTGTVWQVTGVSHSVGQSIYELVRAIQQSQGSPRGIA